MCLYGTKRNREKDIVVVSEIPSQRPQRSIFTKAVKKKRLYFISFGKGLGAVMQGPLFDIFGFSILGGFKIVGFFFNALPGLDAHTRLLLGRYIEYRVTEKV